MAGQNEHTGARLVSKTLSKDGQDNWDRIFGKRIKEQKLTTEDMLPEYELNKSTGEVQTADPITKPALHNILRPESSRIDIIGQNGNNGDHY
jgi:hypothetical protein